VKIVAYYIVNFYEKSKCCVIFQHPDYMFFIALPVEVGVLPAPKIASPAGHSIGRAEESRPFVYGQDIERVRSGRFPGGAETLDTIEKLLSFAEQRQNTRAAVQFRVPALEPASRDTVTNYHGHRRPVAVELFGGDGQGQPLTTTR
jgi:hypothetical protein